MKCFKTGILLLFLSSILILNNPLFAWQPNDVNTMSVDEIASQMTRMYPAKTFIANVVKKTNKEPEFRKELIDIISERLSMSLSGNKMGSTIRALRELNATETVMELIKIWNETEKKVELLESADVRIHLLTAIAQFLPEGERVLFLMKTESDETEDPVVRFRANILLCATENLKAIDYVIEAYEKAKEKFPSYLTMSLEQERNSNPWITESDEDGDGLSSYTERGLLLDPNNIDTDGDGLRDGNDRNPFYKASIQSALTSDQEMAHFIFYLYSRFYGKSPSPFDFNLWLVSPFDYMDGTEKPSLFADMQFTGIDGIVLHMNGEQFSKFRKIHGYSTYISIHKLPGDNEQKDTRQFILTISSNSNFRSYNMIFKHFYNVWLPVYWELGEIT